MNAVEAQRGGQLGILSEGTNTNESNTTESQEPTIIMPMNSTFATNLTSNAANSILIQKINHSNYIYIWAIAIFGCIILTSARYY